MPVAGGSLKSTRKRTMTSCLECYRRKQKVPALHFSREDFSRLTMPQSSETWGQQSRVPRDQSENVPTQDDQAGGHSGPGNLGYSLVPGSNSFMGLQQVLGNEEFQSMTAAQSNASIPILSRINAETLVSNLPPRPVIQSLVNLFFVEVNSHYFILERFYFEDLFSRWPLGEETEPVSYLSREQLFTELRYFSAVLFQLIALTLQSLPPDALDLAQLSANDLAAPQTYSDLGDELLSVLGRPGVALAAVQADFVRSSCLKNYGRGTESWHALGHAIRQAQELGLHRHKEIYQPDQANVDKTLSLFCFMAMILGRPRMIHRDDCDAKLPMECSIPRNPSTAVPMAVRPDESPSTTTVSASLFRYAIACKIHEMRAIKADYPHPKVYSVIRKLHEDTTSSLNGLPSSIRPDYPDTSWDLECPYLPHLREELKMTANLFLMNLHRPYIFSSTESRKAALQAAFTTLDSQLLSFAQAKQHQYHLFGLAFYTVDASFLLSIIAISCPPENHEARQNIENIVHRSIESLSTMERYNPIAKTGLAIVQRCYIKLKEAFKPPSNACGPNAVPRGSSTTVLQNLMRDLNEEPLDPSVNSLRDSRQHARSPELGSSAFTPHVFHDNFSQTYWLEQLNQIQPSLLYEQDAYGVWGNLYFD
ncbi:hypothetical protein PENFLA_c019G07943 [Penicillium flavigenum]|uniref:Xylanolytic transcriptional activator regulatory domain-containing protein n=1 Tax=Penicillium flavigenum TaxID=254877 RepID=A0A1V6SZJ4_9EURO|nr:hypothetical protein PENFLA_c019G07943 [Penicillium flavigenum]